MRETLAFNGLINSGNEGAYIMIAAEELDRSLQKGIILPIKIILWF